MQREVSGIKRSTSLSAIENAPSSNTGSSTVAPPPVSSDSCSYSLPYFLPAHPLPSSPVKAERPRKRFKLDYKPPATLEISNLRNLICDYKRKLQNDAREAYAEYRTELLYLQTGGNITDYYIWKKKSSSQLSSYVKANPIDSDDEDDKRKAEVSKASKTDAGAILAQLNKIVPDASSSYREGRLAVTVLNTTPLSSLPGSYQSATPSPTPRVSQIARSASVAAETVPSTSEVIVERAKQEAQIMQRIAELRKQGLWSARRLPKVQEPPRNKAHWDYLLEEMQWLAADFAQERKLKRASCRKVARLVARHCQDKVDAEKRAEKEGEQRIRKIASTMAKCIRDFWCSIEKVVQFKQHSRLEEKRRKALDTHLNFIVDQTEKYSNWLMEGFGGSSIGMPLVKSVSSNANDDFSLGGEDDDESDLDEESRKKEIEELQKESSIPLEDLLCTLPQEVLEKPASISSYDTSSDASAENKPWASDEEFAAVDGSTDDEETLNEQEAHEENAGHDSDELKQLQTESELPVEKLLEMYAGAGPYEGSDMPETPRSSVRASSDEDSEDDDSNPDTKVGIEYLLHPEKPESDVQSSQKNGSPSKEITDIAAAAESLQPTGYTLETTKVKTPIPMLLKLCLREYQHVGLDWLATMYEKKLNGILADEMGLGKTIQTIALFAHLACEHGVWGPHLIVVPTSVMLNWEIEFKKWCPAFKLLTYYGTPKERKMKRQGWTKTNAFHVCITSYKLVIQDHQSFRRKKWKYLVLDEAQNIKNFKSQRWQTLLNFSSQRRLLLTGTPLQNSLMELWSLMHFLMPNVFSSHNEFKEWFANPLTGMIEGNQEYNESLVRRLHKVLRPFLLRRLKQDVEKQMPKKYERIVKCRLSKRQRFLYDDFMSQRQTKEILASGQFLSVINILMQLRKVCNHPDLFDPRPIVSPFHMEGITYTVPSLILDVQAYHPFKHVSSGFYPSLASLEVELSAYAAHRMRKLHIPPRKLIEEIDCIPEHQPRPQPTKLQPFKICLPAPPGLSSSALQRPASPQVNKTVLMNSNVLPSSAQPKGVLTAVAASAVPVSLGTVVASPVQGLVPMHIKPLNVPTGPITLQIQQTQQGTRVMLPSPGFMQLVSNQRVFQQSNNQITSAITQISQSVVSANNSLHSASALAANSVANAGVHLINGLPVNSTRSSLVSPSVVSTSGCARPAVHQPPLPATDAEDGDVPGNKFPSSSRANVDDIRGLNDYSLAYLQERKISRRKETLFRLATVNTKRCRLKPVYGRDLCKAVNVWQGCGKAVMHGCQPEQYFGVSDLETFASQSDPMWTCAGPLRDACRSAEAWLHELRDIIERFVFVTPPVVAMRGVTLRAAHYPPSHASQNALQEVVIRQVLSPVFSLLHPVQSRMAVQFPEKRLIQYDCGKLQKLDGLLRQLKKDSHRVLIFTQMTRMLDVLEAFLNFHGYRYLRLDGTTRVENRQILMDRFNLDKKIFCFILSTRSGGIGVNLTGADTVIFYDSDWNPTMDAQAQDRCHRIGQTRDVYIYRLISEKTVEENILKKSNQKRMLGDVAIEGGNFTTAFFKERTIKELFEEPTGLSVVDELQAYEQAKASALTTTKPVYDGSGDSAITQSQLEQALCNAEDEQDIQAAVVARAEQSAELAEFDENIPWDEKEADQKKRDELWCSKVEEEIASIERELKPVERLAVRFLEETDEQFSSDALKMAEDDIEVTKQSWELARLKALREEEERKAELEEDEVLFTYSRDDAYQVFKDVQTDETMDVWGPPTPPTSDSDMYYVDHSLNFLYESVPMVETALPPVYTKREKRRIKQDSTSGRKRMRVDEIPRPPRSLFDRPGATSLKAKRDMKAQKQTNVAGIVVQRTMGGSAMYSSAVASAQPQALSAAAAAAAAAAAVSGTFPGKYSVPLVAGRPAIPDVPHDQPEWLIHEDWALLQAVQILQQMPLNLTVVSPAHSANWDLVADTVNAISRIYRSPKQCKLRYENIIIPREEGKILYDVTPRKPAKKGKGIYKTRNNRPMKTSQLYMQDHGSSVTTLHAFRFDCIKNISAKRLPLAKPTLVHATQRNPKHAAVLSDNGIAYDQPLTPVQAAAIRQERINKEKKISQCAGGTVAGSVPGSAASGAVSAMPSVITQVPGSTSLAALATPISVAPIDQQQQPQIQLLTTRALAVPSVTQAVPAGLMHQRGAGTILPVASGVALAQPGVAHQQLPSVASLSIAPSSVSISNVMTAAGMQKQQAGQNVSIARSLSSTSGGGSIVVNTGQSSAAAISKQRMSQVPATGVTAVAAAASAPLQATAVAASPGAAATMASFPRVNRPLSIGELAGVRMAATQTAAPIRQLQSVAATTTIPTGAVASTASAGAVSQQLQQSRLLQQPQQLMQVKQQMIKQRSAAPSTVPQLAQRLPGTTQLVQTSQPVTHIQQTNAVSVTTLVKNVTSGTMTPNVTIPMIGGVNINVSLASQKVAVTNPALAKASTISPPVSGQPVARPLQIQQVSKQKPVQTPQLTQKVALPASQIPTVGKIPGTLPQGQVPVVQQKMNTASIAHLQHIIQQQQKPGTTAIIAMHPVSQTPGGQAAGLGAVSMTAARQLPMPTTLTIMPSGSATSLVAPAAVQSSSSSSSASHPSPSPSQ